MKKILMALFLTLAVSASCLAAGASGRFSAEERIADSLVNALTGNTVTYEEVSKNFSQQLRTGLTAENFANAKNEIRKQVGNIRNINFVLFNRQYDLQKGYNGIDELVYLGSAGKGKFARIFVAFEEENGAPKVTGFQVTPLEQIAQPPAK